jgi:hypothetical protein
MTKELLVVDTGDLTEFVGDFADDTKLGGKVGAADLALPFVKVLQGLSGQLKREKPEYIKGAAIGDICLTVLNRLWPGDEGVEIVFCHYTRVFVEWRPLEAGGGILGVYAPEDKIVGTTTRGEKGVLLLPNGNALVETAYHAVLVKVDGRWVTAVMPLKSTMLKISRKMNNTLTTYEIEDALGKRFQAPRWARIFRMTTGTATGGGNDWAVPMFTALARVDKETYLIAREWAIAANKSTNFASAEAAQEGGRQVDIDSDQF